MHARIYACMYACRYVCTPLVSTWCRQVAGFKKRPGHLRVPPPNASSVFACIRRVDGVSGGQCFALGTKRETVIAAQDHHACTPTEAVSEQGHRARSCALYPPLLHFHSFSLSASLSPPPSPPLSFSLSHFLSRSLSVAFSLRSLSQGQRERSEAISFSKGNWPRGTTSHLK